MFCKKIAVLCLSCLSAFCEAYSSCSLEQGKLYTAQKTENPKQDEVSKPSVITQEDLFNMIRKGVVAIKVRGHVIMERLYNDKMWAGTGFIVDLNKGLIVTNSHVAGEMAVCTYEVKFGNGVKADAKLEYIDPCYDIAVLSVDPKAIPSGSIALEMSDEPVTVNTAVYSMGNSLGDEFSTYPGTIFDTYSILWLKPFPEQSIQFSGLTVPGASGSPVFRSDGKVIGLLYGGKFSSGAALPVKYVKPIVETMKKGLKFVRYFYGFLVDYMTIQDAVEVGVVDKETAETYEKEYPGANNKVLYVVKKPKAYSSGAQELEPGDIIMEVEGQKIGCYLQRLDDITQSKTGGNLSMTVFRNGAEKTVTVKTHKMKSSDNMRLLSFAGATFFETNDDVCIRSGKNETGVFITSSEPGSPFMQITESSAYWREPIPYQITMIDSHKIVDLDDFVKVLPEIMKKKVVTIRYTKTVGDGQEISITSKYSPEFAESVLYTFDNTSKTWKVDRINNPLQTNIK